MSANKYRVVVSADASGMFAANGLQFDTIDQAIEYGKDLFSRWTLVTEWIVLPVKVKPDSGSYWSGKLARSSGVGGSYVYS